MRTKEEMLQGMNMVEFLTMCKLDFKFFCERMLGLTDYGGIHEYHLEWYYTIQNNNRIIIEAPSGFAKTTIVGVAYPLWVLFHEKGRKLLLISKSKPQAKDAMLMNIRDYIEDNEILKDLMPKNAKESWNQTQLVTTNKNSLIMRPYSVNIKGYRADYIIMDEIDSYEDTNIFFDYVVSRLNPGGRLIGISTPEHEGRLIGLIKARNLKNYVIKTYPAITSCEVEGDLSTGKSIWQERFNIEQLMNLRAEQGEQFFQKNYMCNVKVGSEDSIFKLPYILDCFDTQRDFTNIKESKDGFVILAADFAISSGPKADFDAYVIIEKRDNLYIIKYIETWKGVPTPAKVSRIQELIEEYSVDLVIADESNVGVDAIDTLRTKGYYVIGQKFSSDERKKLLVTLKRIIESKKLIIPRDENNWAALELTNKMTTQLTGFIEKESERSHHKLLASTALHDDIAISLAMAITEGTKQETNSFFDKVDAEAKKPKLHNPFNQNIYI